MKKIISAFAATIFCCGLAGTATAATYSYEGSSVAIKDTDWTFVSITEPINASGNITDVDVFVDISFTSIGFLDIYVVHWDADRKEQRWVQLYNDNERAFYFHDLPSVTFDDDALVSIDDANIPSSQNPLIAYDSGSYRVTTNPDETASTYGTDEENLLSYLDGRAATGNWYLVIYDNYGGEKGSVNKFSVSITTDADTSPVPLPGALVCLGSGLSALAAVRRVRRK